MRYADKILKFSFNEFVKRAEREEEIFSAV